MRFLVLFLIEQIEGLIVKGFELIKASFFRTKAGFGIEFANFSNLKTV